MKCQDTYKEVRTYTYPNCTVRVHRPDLTEDERVARIKTIQKAAARLLMAVVEKEQKGET